jgi:Leucine-rich repeat (LRR) protein
MSAFLPERIQFPALPGDVPPLCVEPHMLHPGVKEIVLPAGWTMLAIPERILEQLTELISLHITEGGGFPFSSSLAPQLRRLVLHNYEHVAWMATSGLTKVEFRYCCRRAKPVRFDMLPVSLMSLTFHQSFALLEEDYNTLAKHLTNLRDLELGAVTNRRTIPHCFRTWESLRSLRLIEWFRIRVKGKALPPNLETLYIGLAHHIHSPFCPWIPSLRVLHIAHVHDPFKLVLRQPENLSLLILKSVVLTSCQISPEPEQLRFLQLHSVIVQEGVLLDKCDLPELARLDISHLDANFLGSVPPAPMVQLRARNVQRLAINVTRTIRVLALQMMNLKHIPQAIQGLDCLKVLDLSHNSIAVIAPNPVFPASLQELLLCDNHLYRISPHVRWPKDVKLRLEENPLLSDQNIPLQLAPNRVTLSRAPRTLIRQLPALDFGTPWLRVGPFPDLSILCISALGEFPADYQGEWFQLWDKWQDWCTCYKCKRQMHTSQMYENRTITGTLTHVWRECRQGDRCKAEFTSYLQPVHS